MNFMFSVESEFDVQFSEDEFIGFEDIGGLKRMLAEKVILLVSASPDRIGCAPRTPLITSMIPERRPGVRTPRRVVAA